MRSKRTKATDFNQKTREAIYERDGYRCIFCMMGYRREEVSYNEELETMHFIPRSQGGLGIEQNAALGCRTHHRMMDNGLYRHEMQALFEEYLSDHYEDWNKSELVYNKWADFKIN